MQKTNFFFFNGEKYGIIQTMNLFDVITYFDYNTSLLVLEYNNFICPKKNWHNVFLQNEDKIELVTIVGGG
jgi:thiamine biosynthesis protein ThiS